MSNSHQPARSTSRLGVALSGGGVRASLFALGALAYLVDSRHCERVSEISSVSGGSITNALIAQRCDFNRVSPEEFDRHAAELARAICRGLVPRAFLPVVLVTFSIVAIAVVTLFNLYGDVDSWLSTIGAFVLTLGCIALFGTMLLLRGFALSFFLERRLFGLAGNASTLCGIESSVRHVWCATDLNSSMPVYFTSSGRHLYSPAWGRAAPEKAGTITLADVVRASAAFPGGIPPKKLDVRDFGMSPTPIHRLQQLEQLIFRDVRGDDERPRTLYLADGGVWNNLGTDWFEPGSRSIFTMPMDNHLHSEELLVVDAGAPTPAKRRLPGFSFPFVAEFAVLFRVWLVSYTSTVHSRLSRLPEQARVEHTPGSWATSSASVARMVDAVSAGRQYDTLVWLGDPQHWSGRMTSMGFLRGLVKGRVWKKRWVVLSGHRFHEWSSAVPTTLFSIPSEIAVHLLRHGYISACEAMSPQPQDAHEQLPGIERFTRLLDLEAQRLPGHSQVVALGSKSAWDTISGAELADPLCALMQDLTDVLQRVSERNSIASGQVATMIDEGREHSALIDREIARRRPEWERQDRWIAAWRAMRKGDYGFAVEQLDAIFSTVRISDDSITWSMARDYATALTALGDARAVEVVEAVEKKIGNSEFYPWWFQAQLYASIGCAESCIRCLRSAHDLDRRRTRLLLQTREARADSFARVRNSPEFETFERDVQRAAAENASDEKTPNSG